MKRFGIFNVVGVVGFTVQLAVLWLLVHHAGVHYLAATAIATEAAVLHNFAWHRFWTWRDRAATRLGWLGRLGRFHLANGAVSLGGNVALMYVFTGVLGVPYLPANVTAVMVCASVNFLAGDRWVFREARPSGKGLALFRVPCRRPIGVSRCSGITRLPTSGRRPRSAPADT